MKNEEILNKLFEKTMENEKVSEKDFINSGRFFEKHPNRAKYYFKEYEKNIYKLSDKMKKVIDKNHARAIYNSAVMIYNLLGEDIIWNENKYKVEYEKELLVIRDKIEKEHIAHLDFFMASNSQLIFGEAKMTEWMHSPKYLKEAYLIEKNYIDKEDTKFIKIFSQFIKDINGKKYKTKSGYKSIYKKYDAFQMLIHILGIYRYVRNGGNNKITDIRLVNVVWGNDAIDLYKKESKEAKNFVTKANEIFNSIFAEYNVNFKVEYYNYYEFKNKIKFDDKNRDKYLKRYDIFE